jgi:hypothetical protein
MQLSPLMAAIAVSAALGSLVIAVILRRRTRRPRETKADYTYRLLHPDFDAVAARLGCPLPPLVQALYAAVPELLKDDFSVIDPDSLREWHIGFFCPADARAVESNWPGMENCFEFANDGCGNAYYIRPGHPDPPVVFYDHESGSQSPVAPSFSEFMSWVRVAQDA